MWRGSGRRYPVHGASAPHARYAEKSNGMGVFVCGVSMHALLLTFGVTAPHSARRGAVLGGPQRAARRSTGCPCACVGGPGILGVYCPSALTDTYTNTLALESLRACGAGDVLRT